MAEKTVEFPKKKEKIDIATFDWAALDAEINPKKSTSDGVTVLETGKEKFFRKIREDPFVPIGFLATCGFLFTGIYYYQKRNSRMSQFMMRGRIAAQAFTIFAMMGATITTQLGWREESEEEKKQWRRY